MTIKNKWITGSIIGLAIIGFVSASSYSNEQAAPTGQHINQGQEEVKITSPQNIHYYTNSRGNEVQSPTRYNAEPAGATAQCRDGTYSFSQSRRGTCSHHGGVADWL